MSDIYTETLNKLIEEFAKLPGIGPKTAERLAFHILNVDSASAMALAQAINDVKTKIHSCKICYNFSEETVCNICSDSRRDQSIICVVEHPRDIISLEKTGSCKWVYHVLGGHIAPLEEIEPSDLTIDQLIERVRKDSISYLNLFT